MEQFLGGHEQRTRPPKHSQPRNPQISSAMSKWLINNSRISFNAHKTIAPNWGWQWSHIQPRFQIVVRAYWNKFGRCLLVTSELRKRPGISDVDNASRDCFWGRAFCLRPLKQSHDPLSTSLLPGLLRNSEMANTDSLNKSRIHSLDKVILLN